MLRVFSWETGKHSFGLVLLLALGINACSWFRSSDQTKEVVAEDAAANQLKKIDPKDDPDYPNPAKVNAWEVQVLLTIATHPKYKKELKLCKAQLTKATKKISQEDDLIKIKDNFKKAMQTDAKPFHWCFYQGLYDLDQALAQGKQTADEKGTLFFASMEELWVLARALDEVRGVDLYFDFLRGRYVQISEEIFGRDVSVLGRPLDQLPRPAFNPQKPAGESKAGGS